MKNEENRIKILPPHEARRIAAGEVIDRPAALAREFLDNAIDASSANIELSIEEGGCKKVEVSDDGAGMKREDLEICSLAHATSKINGLDDLDTALTLGFRGEALAAAAAVSRLEIITSADGREAWLLRTGPGTCGENHPDKLEQTRRTRGTTARSLNLFESMPARKRFLKREGSEAALCRQVFIDKALAFNLINFRYLQDGKPKEFLPAVQSKKERFAAALQTEADFLHEINAAGAGFSAAVVIGGPQLYRNDRRFLYVFANGRRVQDFSLIQAMEYGAGGWFPNGTHPVGALFIDIDPSLADFNIHPAKREVRFRDPGAIHHSISGTVKSFFHNLYLKDSRPERGKEDSGRNVRDAERRTGKESEFKFSYNDYITKQDWKKFENAANNSSAREIGSSLRLRGKSLEPVFGEPRYAGRAFGLFILIEWGDKLYIIDQHAAHERILYNKFLEEPVPKQELLSPIPFSTESAEDDAFLEAKREDLLRLGIAMEKDGAGWLIEALPADWRTGDAATIREILNLRTAGENMIQRWAATLCCHAAVKDGDYPDDETAFALGKEALALREPRCPHGRPIWTEISREALYKAVRRE